MTRPATLAAVALLLAVGHGSAADAPPAGSWKLTFAAGRGQEVTFLFAFKEAGGKWSGEYLASSLPLKTEPKFAAVAVDGSNLKFTLNLGADPFISFDGRAAADGKKVNGTISLFGKPPQIVEMYPTKLAKFGDPFELARENLSQAEDGPLLFDAAFDVLAQASAKKMKADEVRGLVERVGKAAGTYGPTWERAVALRLANTLAGQEGLAEVALAQARRAERMLTDDDDAATVMEVLQIVVRGLTLAGKVEEAKPLAARISKLEVKDFQDYAKTHPPFAPEAYKGRKAVADRAVLVEFFTGSECPPCVAADLAAAGLLKSYTPAEVVVLQYHYHIPGPDPLTSPDSAERIRQFEEVLKKRGGFPAAFVNGKLDAEGGGTAAESEKKYKALRAAIDEQLERPAGVKLGLTVSKQDKGYALKAAVAHLAAPGETMSLRFAVAEDRVRYKGGNGLRYHPMVVRAMPGGAKGFPLTKKTHEQTVTVDVDELRAKLDKSLDEFVRTDGEFPNPSRPLALKNLKAVAFVQNDATGEVLQVVQVDLDGK